VTTSSNGPTVRPDQAIERFFEQTDIRRNLAFLRERLPPEARIVVAGGAVRNVIIAAFYGSAPPTRDIDLFIGGLERHFSLAAMLKDQAARPTDLKGMRWHPAGSDLVYDLCLLHDFLGIAAYRLEPTMSNLLAGIDFTINAILFDVDRRSVVERGCTAAIQAGEIDFNSRRIPDKGLLAYRALLMAHKTGFRLSPSVFDYLRNRLEVGVLRQVKGYLQAKLGKAAAAVVMGGYDALCRHHSYQAYRASWAKAALHSSRDHSFGG
jgi:hypothetical protein